MTPYQYVTNNPIMFTDPTGMEQEGGIKDWWNKVSSFLGSSTQAVPSEDEVTELDEVVVFANRKRSFWKRIGFSKDEFSRDWENNKEKSGWNHFANYKDAVGGTGGYKIWGAGSEDRGNFKSEDKPKSINASDMGNIGAGGANLGAKLLFFRVADGIQMFNSAYSGRVSIKDDENVKRGVETIKRTLYNGVNDSLLINLNPKQNNILQQQSPEGEKFRDSLRKKYNFNTYK
ncbi:hypothetical protein P3875_02095 [Myroides sp. JBRI-B21084]|nr:hypothetical protein P3875_02095 [Paenimyroides cloacae]